MYREIQARKSLHLNAHTSMKPPRSFNPNQKDHKQSSIASLLKTTQRILDQKRITQQNPHLRISTSGDSNSFRSGQNRYPTGNRPIFVGSWVGSVLEHGQIES